MSLMEARDRCFIDVELLVRHVSHCQQLPLCSCHLGMEADDAHDGLTFQGHAPNIVQCKRLQVWNGDDPAEHAMSASLVPHNW